MRVDILSFKEKDKYIRYIYKKYRKAKLELEKYDMEYNYYPHSSVMVIKDSGYYNNNKQYNHYLDRKKEREVFVKMIDNIHRQMSKDSLNIIKKEYFDVYDKNWWTENLSKSSYYRLKNKAFEEFFEYFDEKFLVK